MQLSASSSSSSSVAVNVEPSNNPSDIRSAGVAHSVSLVHYWCWLLVVGGLAVGFALAVRHEVMRHKEQDNALCNQQYVAQPFQVGPVSGARQRIVWNLGRLVTTPPSPSVVFIADRQCITYDVPPSPGTVSRFMYANDAQGCCFQPESVVTRGWQVFGLVILGLVLCLVCLSPFTVRCQTRPTG